MTNSDTTLKDILENYLVYIKGQLASKSEITNGDLSFLYGWLCAAKNLNILSVPGYALGLLMLINFDGEQKVSTAKFIDAINSAIQISEEFGTL